MEKKTWATTSGTSGSFGGTAHDRVFFSLRKWFFNDLTDFKKLKIRKTHDFSLCQKNHFNLLNYHTACMLKTRLNLMIKKFIYFSLGLLGPAVCIFVLSFIDCKNPFMAMVMLSLGICLGWFYHLDLKLVLLYN